MSQTLERLAKLEGELCGHVYSDQNTDEKNAAIRRCITLAAREGYEHCCYIAKLNSRGFNDVDDVKFVYPLPPKRVLREEPDPNGVAVLWRWNGQLEYSPTNLAAYPRRWIPLFSDENGRVFAPYPKRIDLWHSLKHQPYTEVPDDEG